MPNPRTVALPSTQGVAAPYFANYVKDQLVTQYGPTRAFGGGLKVTTTLDMNLQQMARDAIAQVLPQNGTDPTVALVAIDARHTARCWRWSAARTTTRASSTSRRRASASRARRSSRSCSQPRCKENISPTSDPDVVEAVTINAGGRLWQVNNYEGE